MKMGGENKLWRIGPLKHQNYQEHVKEGQKSGH